MFRNYLLTAWRHLLRHQTFTLLNVLGLSLGMAACLLIVQYVHHEQSYDQFHEQKDQLYRVAQQRFSKGILETEWAAGCAAIGPAMKEAIPEVSHMTTIRSLGGTMNYENEFFREEKMFMVMPDFFRMFSFPILEGDPAKDFEKPYQAMVSTTTATKYFGEESPIGKTVKLDRQLDFTIVGVFEDVPETSHMQFDWLFSYQTFIALRGEEILTAWQWDGFYTYVALTPEANLAEVEPKVADLVEQRAGEELSQYGAGMSFFFQPVTDIHLTSDLMIEMEANGNGTYVQFLWLIAFFILGIAWVNYINLATAKASERAREVGIRKMMGSHTATLMPQFLGEALLTNLLAAAIAIVLAWLALPLFNGLTGQELSLSLLTKGWFWIAALGVLLLGSFLSGLYPALILSSFQPVKVLKGSFASSSRGILLRKLLVGLQFGISLLLIAGTLTVYQQLNFMRSQDLGVDIDQTLVLKAPNIADSTYSDRLTAMKTEMARHAAVRTVANSTSVPGRKASWNAGGIRRVGEPESASKQYRVIGVDYDFVEAYGLSVAHGRSFDESYGTEESKVLFNESAMKLMEFEEAEDALGEEIFFWGDTFQIIGILKDYHQQSLKVAHDPLIFRFIPGSRTYFSVKMEPGTDAAALPAVLTHVEESWRNFFPESPMEYFFLDDYFEEQYNNDQQFGQAFGVFAILAILIACLGLVGLTSFTTLQRTKEVGIRKVLGASEGNIVHLLTKDVLLLIGISAVIVLPLAGYLMNMWLEEFAYHISLDWFLFLLPVFLLTLITLLSVGIQTIRAARTNPIDALRYE